MNINGAIESAKNIKEIRIVLRLSFVLLAILIQKGIERTLPIRNPTDTRIMALAGISKMKRTTYGTDT